MADPESKWQERMISSREIAIDHINAANDRADSNPEAALVSAVAGIGSALVYIADAIIYVTLVTEEHR